MGDVKFVTAGTMDAQDWPQAWEWEQFLFGGRLLRCGYASDRVQVLVVVLAATPETTPAVTH